MTVTRVQIELKQAGLYHGKIDGDWGPMTMSAFLSLQERKGVVVPEYVRRAAHDLGVKEIPGSGTNPRILEYHKHTTLQATEDEVAWCSAAVNCWMDEGGIQGTDSAAARSWLQWGREIKIPVFGCVAVRRRGSSNWQGHVALYMIGDDESQLWLGGNQSDRVNVASFSLPEILGYRMPS